MRDRTNLSAPLLLLSAFIAGAILPTIFLTAAGQAHVDRYLSTNPNAAAWVQAIMGGLAVIVAVVAAAMAWSSSIYVARRNTLAALTFDAVHLYRIGHSDFFYGTKDLARRK